MGPNSPDENRRRGTEEDPRVRGLEDDEQTPAVTGLDVIVSKAGKIEALYTFLDPAQK